MRLRIFIAELHPDQIAVALESESGETVTALITPDQAASAIAALADCALTVTRVHVGYLDEVL